MCQCVACRRKINKTCINYNKLNKERPFGRPRKCSIDPATQAISEVSRILKMWKIEEELLENIG